MKIKVCGLRDADNIKAVAALEPDYMGIEILNAIPAHINKTAVFVDESAKTISALIDKYNFDFVQLHGNETPAFCKALRDQAIVIKAFGIHNEFDFSQLSKYKNKVDLFLFDAKTDIHGGSGKTFDWDILDKYDMDNLEEVKKITHPQFYGVDLNSKFEISPGMKDIEKLEKAFTMLKNINDEIRS
jgi:phosphoribosylanthranilate isomerase